MLREIKFRAWDEQKKVMHHDFEFIRSGTDGNDWIVFKSDIHPLSGKPHPLENPHFQQQLKIMQFTELKDNNGKEIYEGDICSLPNGLIGQILYKAPIFALISEYGSTAYMPNEQGIEVLGNIHEKPELLEAGKC